MQPAMSSSEQPALVVADAEAWRRWLMEHYQETPGVWLRLAKKGVTTPTSLRYDAALDEALCFGWIDGQMRGGDEATYRQRFTPRRRRSTWSQRNVSRVTWLMSEQRMHPAGIAEVERAKADGRWDAAYPGQAAAVLPADLLAGLAGSPEAQAMFSALTAQNRYALIHRLMTARTAAIRAKRVEQYVTMLGRGESIHPQKRRPGG